MAERKGGGTAKGPWARGSLTIAAIVAALVVLVSVNLIAGSVFHGARVDLTADRLYTLSKGTRAVVSEIDEPVSIAFYFSQDIARAVPPYAILAQRVRDLLGEYQRASGGRLIVTEKNPQPFSQAEDEAEAAGLQALPIDGQGNQGYFGLVATNSTDDREIIPVFDPNRDRFLEYDLTAIINKLAKPKQPVVGLISRLPLEKLDPRASTPQNNAALDQVRNFFQIRELQEDVAEIPADIDVLMVVHPADLPASAQYAIDQFVLRGGRAMVFVDPYSETTAFEARSFVEQGMPPPPTASTFEKLLSAWGIEMKADAVAADRRFARRVSAPGESRLKTADYVAWLSVTADGLNPEDPITADLQKINLATAGVLAKRVGATTTLEPLISTTTQSETIATAKVEGLPDVAGLLEGFKPGGTPLILAARVTGPVKSAFPDGPPPPDAKAEANGEAAKAPKPAATAPGLKESKTPINVIIIADTDLLADRMWVSSQDFFGQSVAVPTANNGDFVLDALENLRGGGAVSTLRARAVVERPFTVIDDLQNEAESRYREKERALRDKLRDTERKLADLRNREASAPGAASDQQAEAVKNFRAELLRTRAELRTVQRSLREDIETLEARIRFANIAAVPMLVALFAVGLGLFRARRRARSAAAH